MFGKTQQTGDLLNIQPRWQSQNVKYLLVVHELSAKRTVGYSHRRSGGNS